MGPGAFAYDIVVVGTSLGGLHALETLLADLPDDFPLPVVVVQHRSAAGGSMLTSILQRHTPLRVREPQDKEAICPGRVYLAPADYHLLVEDGHFEYSTEGPVSYARPSIDVLFESAADAYGCRVVGVVLTGANHDGASGAGRIKESGGYLVVQDPATAESRVMPAAAIAAAPPDQVVPLERIADVLMSVCGGVKA